MDDEIIEAARRELEQACAELYQRFAAYRLPEHVAGCPHCVSDQDHARLYRRPLRALQREDLGRFAFKAMTTWGDEDDFRHFLPRLFELAPQRYGGGGADVPVEILYGKLGYGGWRQWPAAEQQAVERYLRAVWDDTLLAHEPDQATESEAYLCAIAQAVDDLRPYLARWQELMSRNALANLSTFIAMSLADIVARHRLGNAFWSNRPEQQRQVVSWLLDPTTADAYEQAFERHLTTPLADALARVVDALRQLQSYG